MKVIDWFARNGVAANLLLLIIAVSGAMSACNTKLEVMPEFSLDLITVTVPYLGAAPEEVEQAVCIRVEEAIQGVEGVKRLTSVASEGSGRVVVELLLNADRARVLDDIKSRVDAIDTFPDETEEPIVREVTNRRQVINVAIWGDAELRTLKFIAERVRDDLSALPGITQVEISNAPPYEISIEVAEASLRRHGLSFDQVASAVRVASLDLPGGSVKTEGGEILLRTKGQAYRGHEFEQLVLLTRPDGTRLLLGDVANIVDGFADTDQWSRFQEKPAVLVDVFRVGDQGAIDIVDKVREYLIDLEPSLPVGINVTTWGDSAKVLEDRLDLLVRNGIAGLVLVFLTLALFLRFRLAMWVSLGIPVSFLGALWMMPGLDVSINMISLFAFIVVLGIVVDDAIVVGENIYTHQERHGDGLRGAIEGTREVVVPVTFAVLTTVAAFQPLVQVEGSLGKIMRLIPLVVIPCLLFSLLESLLVLPSHLSHMKKRDATQTPGLWRRFQGGFSTGLDKFIQRVYRPSLEIGLRWRYLTVAGGLAILILTVGTVAGGWIRFVFFPDVEADFISVTLTMPQGTPAEVTEEALLTLERSADAVRTETTAQEGADMIRYLLTAVGGHPYREAQSQNAGGASSYVSAGHLGEVTMELVPAEERTVSSIALLERWRELTPPIPDAVEISFSASLFSPGEDINVQLTGADLGQLNAAARELKERLRSYSGVHEVADSFREGKREVQLDILPQAEALGLSLRDLGRQVRQAFYGEEAQRVQRGRDDVRVMVRYPEDERRSLGDLEEMRIRTPDGSEVPISGVADVRLGRGFASIQRVDRRRSINVTAAVDAKRITAGEVVADLEATVLPRLVADHPGIQSSFEGQSAEQRDTMAGLQRGFIVALVAIYALLAVPLRSYLQPLLIMSAIPFGLVGAIWGHLLMGLNLTILSVFGLVALAGVVVNDSLVMVDFINRFRSAGGALEDAVRNAGVARFRAILLTSLTTFAGLTPLLFEKSMQARFLVPMAVSLAFGVVFATFITLVLVPTGYVILEDFQRLIRRLRGLPAGGREEQDAAAA